MTPEGLQDAFNQFRLHFRPDWAMACSAFDLLSCVKNQGTWFLPVAAVMSRPVQHESFIIIETIETPPRNFSVSIFRNWSPSNPLPPAARRERAARARERWDHRDRHQLAAHSELEYGEAVGGTE